MFNTGKHCEEINNINFILNNDTPTTTEKNTTNRQFEIFDQQQQQFNKHSTFAPTQNERFTAWTNESKWPI